jgi:putative transposase
MDFVQDALADGRTLRLLTVEDTYTREGLAIVVDTSISGLRVRRELTRLIAERERPEDIRVDNVLNASEKVRAGAHVCDRSRLA